MKTSAIKGTRALVFCLLISALASEGNAQSKRMDGSQAGPPTRYFQLTLDLNFGAVPDQQSTTQTITTEVAVDARRPGHCKARMLSQMPTGTGKQTKYIELGTKVDCDEVHIEGDGVALQFALETSRVTRIIKTKGADGSEVDEPLISARTVQLNVKLPLDQKKVVFDSSTHPTEPLKPFSAHGSSQDANPYLQAEDPPLVIAMTASELK